MNVGSFFIFKKDFFLEQKICPSCGSLMVKRSSARGDFWGCSSYPQCKKTFNISNMKKEQEFSEVNSVVRCPQCDAPMTKRNGKRGDFYGCTNFFITSCKGFRTVKEVEVYGIGVEQIEDNIIEEIIFSKEEIKIEKPKQEKEVQLIPTKNFPYLEFKFECFNPVQSEVFNYYDKDINCVVAACTSAGKTVVAEMFMAYSIFKGEKAIFLSPLKAVSQEKYDDWTNPKHPWSKLNISIVTGDYQLTEKRVEELNNANIIIMTTEMLDSRSRRITIEKNNWLLKTGTLVQDESHLLCVKGRGDRSESALMRFTKQNPSCRIVFLSATMPNVGELANWLSFLNGKKSELINSNYRPMKLDIHYDTYIDLGGYNTIEQNKIERTVELALQKYTLNEQVLIFVHTKRTGRELLNCFLQKGINSKEIDFHSGDLDLKTRIRIEEKTKTKEIKVLIATSTLAWGVNI